MKRPLAYITAAWCGSDCENAKQAAQYCRSVYDAGFSPICPPLYQPLFLNDFAPGGYVFDNGSRFIEHYSGREDIPDEHKVFSMPKLNIREQMAAYKEIIDRSSLEGERLHPRKEVPER